MADDAAEKAAPRWLWIWLRQLTSKEKRGNQANLAHDCCCDVEQLQFAAGLRAGALVREAQTRLVVLEGAPSLAPAHASRGGRLLSAADAPPNLQNDIYHYAAAPNLRQNSPRPSPDRLFATRPRLGLSLWRTLPPAANERNCRDRCSVSSPISLTQGCAGSARAAAQRGVGCALRKCRPALGDRHQPGQGGSPPLSLEKASFPRRDQRTK